MQQLDLEKHRQALNERLASLTKYVEHTAAGGEALSEFVLLLHVFIENLETQIKYNQAESQLFQNLILAAPRLSADYDSYRKLCLQIEEQLGYGKD